MDPRTGVSPGLKVMVDRATRRKFARQQSPLAACPQKVKDGVEDGTKVGGSRSPARSRSRQNWRNKSPRCVVHVGGVESSAHRTSYGPSGPDQRSFKTDVNFSNTLLSANRPCSPVPGRALQPAEGCEAQSPIRRFSVRFRNPSTKAIERGYSYYSSINALRPGSLPEGTRGIRSSAVPNRQTASPSLARWKP